MLGKAGIPRSPLAGDGLIKQTVYILCLSRGQCSNSSGLQLDPVARGVYFILF